MTKKIIVASTNPVKVAVAEAAFRAVFPGEDLEIIGVTTCSGVSEQPYGDEALMGAAHRLEAVTREHPLADFWISQEGGLVDDGENDVQPCMDTCCG